MSSITREVMCREMEKGNGTVRVVEMPKDKLPTAESLRELEDEIAARLAQNAQSRIDYWPK